MPRGSYIFDAVRTPFGKRGGLLSDTRPDDLVAHLLSQIEIRNPGVASRVQDVFVGDGNGAGEDSNNVARAAVLLADFPYRVPGITLNRICGSGMDAVILASRAIVCGDIDIAIAGGVESMSRAPKAVMCDEDDKESADTALGWRFTNPRMAAEHLMPVGQIAEEIAREFDISRQRQDEFALASHQKAFFAWNENVYSKEVEPIPGVALRMDEGIRPDTSIEKLSRLKPVFTTGELGSVTAGNASPLSDGAALMLVGSRDAIDQKPLARIVSRSVVATVPRQMGTAPVLAAEDALARADLRWSDVDLVEITEAFACQVLACLQGWPNLDESRVNVHGGAIAIGHPIGASGARITGHLAHALASKGYGIGVATCGIGMGQAVAVVLDSNVQ